jgi:hypothetical protein
VAEHQQQQTAVPGFVAAAPGGVKEPFDLAFWKVLAVIFHLVPHGSAFKD